MSVPKLLSKITAKLRFNRTHRGWRDEVADLAWRYVAITAGVDIGERREVHVDVQSKAVVADAMAHSKAY